MVRTTIAVINRCRDGIPSNASIAAARPTTDRRIRSPGLHCRLGGGFGCGAGASFDASVAPLNRDSISGVALPTRIVNVCNASQTH
jgi:hypothetical protein